MKTPSKREILVLTGHRCPTCHAYVGCHKGSLNAKGSVAGRNLRELRKSAHRLFDDMWKSGDMNREDAYEWLSERLGIPRYLTHVGMFDEAQCRRTI